MLQRVIINSLNNGGGDVMTRQDAEVLINNLVKLLDSKGLGDSANVLIHVKNRMQVVIDGDMDFSSVDKLVYEGHLLAILN